MGNELYHFGIKGMHWGVRRFQNTNGTLTVAGKKRYTLDGDKNHSNVKRVKTTPDKELSDKKKKALKIGAAVVGTTLAAYGGYKLYQVSNQRNDKLNRQNAVNKLASEASNLARSVTAEGPKSFSSRTAQNSASTVRAMTSQKLANASRTTTSGRQTTQRVMSVAGQQKFNQASQANNDLVNDLLRRNASMLSGF